MAKHLDLEEQEQLDQLKHFWNQYGNIITWALIGAFAVIAGFNGWQYWQRTQGTQASVLFDQIEGAAAVGDVNRVKQAFGDIKQRFGGTAFAQQGAFLAARALADRNDIEGAKAALSWVAQEGRDEGYRAMAKLRLATLALDAKQYDEVARLLAGELPKDFEPLAADRRGDALLLQGKKDEALAQYTAAWQKMDERAEYRRVVEVKLNSLGVDPRPLATAQAPRAAQP